MLMLTELGILPIIDWEAGKRIVGSRDTANEILNLLMQTLPKDIETIQSCYRSQHYDTMLAAVHSLHGALCYSPTPRLKLVISQLETELKNNIIDRLPFLLAILSSETEKVIAAT